MIADELDLRFVESRMKLCIVPGLRLASLSYLAIHKVVQSMRVPLVS